MSISDFDRNKDLPKIYILGDRGAGKTSLIHLLLGDKSEERKLSSRRGTYNYQYQIGEKDNILISELTDDNNFTQTQKLKNELEQIPMIIILFSIDNENSLEYAKSLILFIKSNITYNLDIQLILLGNKYDSKKINDTKIKVNQIEAENYAMTFDNCTFYELSCKTGLNVDLVKNKIDEIDLNRKANNKDDNQEELSCKEHDNGKSCVVF